ncbi:Hsp20/alpha crystallin family protein [Desulfosarcina sp.]|uniref:Hsp20/alpha crystallin family protein n=1 Tax=Desulfosarcina sp. TaxID=2027861 RepID=UPI0029B507AC|nr:Hsp20/alpha crystallin family protein [Desulfosarcina sp.]MDX2453392.1 Hsp20/alpha crystallin family protein [Desulfosarcina sp.]MDX2491107.1 Hsp20/alpha crystallin family protein [Desulfosarcina sp.]
MSESKEMKVIEKQALASPAEQTKPGPVFTPNVDIFETEKAITLLVDMPGVKVEELNVDLRDDTLTLTGDVLPNVGTPGEKVYMEYETGRYYRQFSLSEVIAQEKIDAKLSDGVLRLTLPKVEKATPRRIAVQAG